MIPCLLVIGIVLACPDDARPDRPPPVVTSAAEETTRDAWFAQDKLRHLTMSFAATSFAYGVGRTTLGPDDAARAGAAAALAAGIAKEVADLRAGGPFSLKDLVWDAAGVAAALALADRIR